MMTTKAPMPGGGGSPSLVIEIAATILFQLTAASPDFLDYFVMRHVATSSL
jgi:hypothetical protein